MSIPDYSDFIERHFPDAAGRLALVDLCAPAPQQGWDSFIAAQITARDDTNVDSPNGYVPLTDQSLVAATHKFYADNREKVRDRYNYFANKAAHFAPMTWVDSNDAYHVMHAAGVIAYFATPITASYDIPPANHFYPYTQRQQKTNTGRVFLHELFHGLIWARNIPLEAPSGHTNEVGADSFAYCIMSLANLAGTQDYFGILADRRLISGFQFDALHLSSPALYSLMSRDQRRLPKTVSDCFDFAVEHANQHRVFQSEQALEYAEANTVIPNASSRWLQASERYQYLDNCALGRLKPAYERALTDACISTPGFMDVANDIEAIHERIVNKWSNGAFRQP